MKNEKLQNMQQRLAELAASMMITSLDNLDPVPEKLAAYLNKCTTDEIRRYFLDFEKFDPLIIQINDKMYVMDMRVFIEHPRFPLTTHKHIKINTIQ